MVGELFECESDRNSKYYRVIHTVKGYKDGRVFPMDEVVVSERKINLNATNPAEMGGFCISTYEYIFRWLIRGDTLCEVKIPQDTKIYKTVSENGIYISDKIILTKPKKIDDDFAMELYLNSTLPEKSYFIALAACANMEYTKTALKVLEDKVNKENIDMAIEEFEAFCKRREQEEYIDDCFSRETEKIIHDKLIQIREM